jgi:hypothetical protein
MPSAVEYQASWCDSSDDSSTLATIGINFVLSLLGNSSNCMNGWARIGVDNYGNLVDSAGTLTNKVYGDVLQGCGTV